MIYGKSWFFRRDRADLKTEFCLTVKVKLKGAACSSRAFYSSMNSPIAHLTDVLQTVRDSAQTFASQLQGSEAATRAALIDPVLRALGWDIANPNRVLVEKTQTVQGKSLQVAAQFFGLDDYALLAGATIEVIVEAKKLGSNLQTNFLQLVTYSFGLNVGSIWVSDGVIWRHYRAISSTDTNPTREFDLSRDDLPTVAAYLVQHMDAALVSPQIPVIDELTGRIETLENLVLELTNQMKAGAHKAARTNKAPAQAATPKLTKIKSRATQTGDNWFAIDKGGANHYKNAIDVLVHSLRALNQISDEMLPEIERAMEAQLAARKTKVIKRRWLAQSKESLYQNPKLWTSSVKIVPGWWVGTNYSNGDKRDMLATVAQVAAKSGIELRSHLV